MATPNLQIIQALRRTAHKLAQGAKYQWGHMGQCNCGNLAQEIVHMTEAEIHAHALRTREGDWSEQTAEYCGNSKLPLDSLITKMLEVGFTITDLQHLERLSDERILKRLPQEKRNLQFNSRHDAITYMLAWADMLEEELLEQLPIPSFEELVLENQ